MAQPRQPEHFSDCLIYDNTSRTIIYSHSTFYAKPLPRESMRCKYHDRDTLSSSSSDGGEWHTAYWYPPAPHNPDTGTPVFDQQSIQFDRYNLPDNVFLAAIAPLMGGISSAGYTEGIFDMWPRYKRLLRREWWNRVITMMTPRPLLCIEK